MNRYLNKRFRNCILSCLRNSEKREARSEKREARSEKREARSEKREARSEKRENIVRLDCIRQAFSFKFKRLSLNAIQLCLQLSTRSSQTPLEGRSPFSERSVLDSRRAKPDLYPLLTCDFHTLKQDRASLNLRSSLYIIPHCNNLVKHLF